jgi:hypothetical protein
MHRPHILCHTGTGKGTDRCFVLLDSAILCVIIVIKRDFSFNLVDLLIHRQHICHTGTGTGRGIGIDVSYCGVDKS